MLIVAFLSNQGAVGNLSKTGMQTAGAVKRGDAKGAVKGLASG